MNKLIIRFVINAFAFFVAITLLSGNGINAQEMQWWGYLGLALIFGIVNAVLRPIVTLLGCPFIVLTLGLGILLINTLMFWLAGQIGLRFGVGFTVEGFWPAFLGALIISVMDMVGGWVVKDEKKHK